MDIDTGAAFQAGLLGSSHAFTAPKVHNAQLSGGLMRYHSAPSSVLAGLLDDDFFPASEDSDFAQLLNDGIGSFSSLLEPKGSQQGDTAQEDVYLHHGSARDQHPRYIGTGSTFQEHLSQIPLSAISEYGVEGSVADFCGNQVPLSTDVVQQAPHQLVEIDGVFLKSGLASTSHANSFNTGLIRQSSSPADFLSRLVMEESSEKMKIECGMAGQHLSSAEAAQKSLPSSGMAGQHLSGAEAAQRSLPSSQAALLNNFTDIKCSSSTTSTAPSPRSNVLLRQSSSPAGLLSQINLDDFSMVDEKGGTLVSASGIFPSEALLDRREHASGRSLAMGGWDDRSAELAMQHFAALGQRKRGRVFDDKLLKGLQRVPIDLGTATMNSFSPPSSSTQASIDCMEGSAEDSVLCKARAKRGCATHPRSIAERQRRIKISERMKKLQDLVPNLDKQANTAEMLDEVVEYVKLLQRQVQELSINRPPCNGSCQQGGNSRK